MKFAAPARGPSSSLAALTSSSWSRGLLLVALFVAAPVALVGCSGELGGRPAGSPDPFPGSGTGAGPGPGGSGTGGAGLGTPPSCDQAQSPPSTRVLRLTRLDLQNSLVDLFGSVPTPLEIQADTPALGFSTAEGRAVDSGYADGLKRLAEGMAGQLKTSFTAAQLPATCFASEGAARMCADRFVRSFGRRAFRRALADREVTALLVVYDAGRETGAAGNVQERCRAGLDYTVRAIVQSPHFIYRSELGASGAAAGAVTRLTQDELATAISYSVTASPPDEELLAAAEAGQLDTPARVTAQVARLASAHPDGFKAQVRRLLTEWLAIDFTHFSWEKNTTLYPGFGAPMKDAIRASFDAFMDDWVTAGPTLPRLLTTPDVFASRLDAPLYGRTSTSTTPARMAIAGQQRAGILTQPAFLATHAQTDASSPIFRGVTVYRKLLCKPPVSVPADVPPLPRADGQQTAATTRQRYENHISRGGAACQTCHASFNPMGYPFESYDAVGGFRTEENGVEVDTSGALVGTRADRTVANAAELAQALAESPEVHECFARQVFRYTMGRAESAYDQCEGATAVAPAFTAQSLDLRELLAAIITSDSFTVRRAAMEQR